MISAGSVKTALSAQNCLNKQHLSTRARIGEGLATLKMYCHVALFPILHVYVGLDDLCQSLRWIHAIANYVDWLYLCPTRLVLIVSQATKCKLVKLAIDLDFL